MKIIGLTGGIGSGKSTVARMFEDLFIPVYYSDDRARRLMNESPSIKKQLIEQFGAESFQNGQLNRALIASIVFDNKDKLKVLNDIVHPEVARDFSNWVSEQNSPYIIQEIPLLFENRKQADYYRIIMVTAPTVLRIERVTQRDGVSRDDVLARMRNQLPDEYKIPLSHYLITNLSKGQTWDRVLQIHKTLHKTIS